MSVRSAKFGGVMTPKQALIDAMDCADQLEMVVIVGGYLDENGEKHIIAGWSTSDLTHRLGAMDMAGDQMKEAARNE